MTGTWCLDLKDTLSTCPFCCLLFLEEGDVLTGTSTWKCWGLLKLCNFGVILYIFGYRVCVCVSFMVYQEAIFTWELAAGQCNVIYFLSKNYNLKSVHGHKEPKTEMMNIKNHFGLCVGVMLITTNSYKSCHYPPTPYVISQCTVSYKMQKNF